MKELTIPERVAAALNSAPNGIYDDLEREVRVITNDGVCRTIRDKKSAINHQVIWGTYPDYPK